MELTVVVAAVALMWAGVTTTLWGRDADRRGLARTPDVDDDPEVGASGR